MTAPADAETSGGVDGIALALLAAAPRPPRDPGLFSSNPLFGEPGIYPDGPPMVPATGPAVDDAGARPSSRVSVPATTSSNASPSRRSSCGVPTPVCAPGCSR